MANWISITIAGLAFLLSAYAVFHEHWRNREASIEIRYEQYYWQSRDKASTKERVVITNHGPAVADDVHFGLLDAEGKTHGTDEVIKRRSGRNPALAQSIPRLHPGQEFHLPVWRSLADTIPDGARVTWRDRRGQQDLRVWLTVQDRF